MTALAIVPAETSEPVSIAAADDVFTMTETGLQVNREYTFSEWQAFGWRIYAGYSAYKWALADWLIMGENRFGNDFAAAKALTGYKEQTLLNYATTARSIPVTERNPLVSFSNHADVASLDPVNRKYALDKLAVGEWDRDKLRKWKRELKGTGERKQELIPAPVTVLAINGTAYAVIDLPADYPVALLRNWVAKIPKPAPVADVMAEAA